MEATLSEVVLWQQEQVVQTVKDLDAGVGWVIRKDLLSCLFSPSHRPLGTTILIIKEMFLTPFWHHERCKSCIPRCVPHALVKWSFSVLLAGTGISYKRTAKYEVVSRSWGSDSAAQSRESNSWESVKKHSIPLRACRVDSVQRPDDTWHLGICRRQFDDS